MLRLLVACPWLTRSLPVAEDDCEQGISFLEESLEEKTDRNIWEGELVSILVTSCHAYLSY